MIYMTFEQQVAVHLQFLREAGLVLSTLSIDSPDFIRCHSGEIVGRGEYAYKTVSRRLNNGMTGLMTWCRGRDGRVSQHKTYGYSFQSNEAETLQALTTLTQSILKEKEFEQDLRRIRKFWNLSSPTGESNYLQRKGVKAHRIRFRENTYGKVAVIPMRDVYGQLRGYQILNGNGSKVFAKRIRINGLFHALKDLIDNVPIGIAESYVTAATCFELLPMPIITAFTSENLEKTAEVLRESYPNSPLVIFADNDKHLSQNKGIVSAKRALKKAQGNGIILAPQFRGSLKGRGYSDWNDLVREIGPLGASEQMWKGLQQTQDDRIKTFYI
jgi:putative DNA primase/helicase